MIREQSEYQQFHMEYRRRCAARRLRTREIQGRHFAYSVEKLGNLSFTFSRQNHLNSDIAMKPTVRSGMTHHKLSQLILAEPLAKIYGHHCIIQKFTDSSEKSSFQQNMPITVIRRLDAVFELTKDAVLKMKEQLDKANVANQHAALCQAAGKTFYNTSPFRLRDLSNRFLEQRRQLMAQKIKTYFEGL